MRLELTGRNVEITPALRKQVEKKLAKLDRLLQDGIVSAQVVLTLEKYRHLADFTVHTRGDHILSGLGASTAWETSISDAVEKLTQQLQKVKGKWQERKRRATSPRVLPVPAEAPPAPEPKTRARPPRPALPGEADDGRGSGARGGLRRRRLPGVPERHDRLGQRGLPPQGRAPRPDRAGGLMRRRPVRTDDVYRDPGRHRRRAPAQPPRGRWPAHRAGRRQLPGSIGASPARTSRRPDWPSPGSTPTSRPAAS